MSDFKTLHANFSESLLGSLPKIPDGLIAVKPPSIEKRFSVYRNNVMVGLVDSLRSNFPIVVKLLGNDFFNAMAFEYITNNPPKSPLLFTYGEDFSNFIGEFQPAATIPYLADVAHLEHNWRMAYHAAEEPCADVAKLQDVAPEHQMNLVFKIHPSAVILKSGWPIYSIWQGHESGDMSIVDLEKSENIVICRPNADVLMAQLDHSACAFFRHIINGKTLGDAYAKAAELDKEFDLEFSFGQLFALGLVTGFKVKF